MIVLAILNNRNRSNNKDANIIKITNFLIKNGIKIDNIKSDGFGKAKVTFLEVAQANKCLAINKGKEEPFVRFVIPNRVRKCRGIISDWDSDMPLSELVQSITQKIYIYKYIYYS